MPIVKQHADILGGCLTFSGKRAPVKNSFDCLVAGDSIK